MHRETFSKTLAQRNVQQSWNTEKRSAKCASIYSTRKWTTARFSSYSVHNITRTMHKNTLKERLYKYDKVTQRIHETGQQCCECNLCPWPANLGSQYLFHLPWPLVPRPLPLLPLHEPRPVPWYSSSWKVPLESDLLNWFLGGSYTCLVCFRPSFRVSPAALGSKRIGEGFLFAGPDEDCSDTGRLPPTLVGYLDFYKN